MATDAERMEAYLYRSHSRQELHEWARAMRFFRFCRAFGGHANDGDELRVSIAITTERDLLDTCKHLGIALLPLPLDTPQPQLGVGYSMEEYSAFRSPMEPFPQWEQPHFVSVAGVKVFVFVVNGSLGIQLSGAEGNPYEVTEVDVQNALAVEGLLEGLKERVIDPPLDSDHCICPKYHPHIWRT